MSGAADPELRTIRLADGRRISWRSYGAAAGRPVLALHGTPGSLRKFEIADDAARAAGLRLLAVDRWGYGRTDPHPAPSLRAFAADMAAFADGAGLERFAVLGISGGGPYAAAVAAELGPRVAAAALVSPVGPIAGTDAAGSLSAFHALAFRGLARAPGAIRVPFLVFRALLRTNADAAMRVALSRASGIDRSTMCAPTTRASLVAAFRDGLAPGVEGPVIDMRLFGSRWDIAPEAIQAPARVWIGTADRHVPIAAARGLGTRIGGGGLVELPGAGHYWIVGHMAEVMGWLDGAGAW